MSIQTSSEAEIIDLPVTDYTHKNAAVLLEFCTFKGQ